MPEPITIPLALARVVPPVRPAAAWLVPSADPARCLAEICAWKVDLLNTRIIPLPHARTNLYPCALLVVPPAGSKVQAGHALPYGWEGKKLLLPVDAILRPALASAELETLITSPLAVWHPVLGLVECDQPEGMRAWQLLEPPRLLNEDWNAAQHAESSLPTLRAIGLRMDQLAADPFGGAGEDIGQKSLGEIPPVPGEPSRNPASQAARKIVGSLLLGGAKIMGGLEKLGGGLMSLLGGMGGGGGAEGSRPPKPGAIREWLERQSAAFFERLERARAAEINRLMEWLTKDPEMALKFALPLTGEGDLGRGIAPPGTRLTQRSTNFRLGGLGGGQASDYWNLQERQRIALINKYRELANRALAEGRHRRAAYIHAQLLGDYASAAEALRQGRFYAEAAVLYRDRLHNKRMAASCLAEGGLLHDAAKLLEELNEWVEAGDLYERMEVRSESQRCYERAVSEALQKKDNLRAATLLEHKLHNLDLSLFHLRDAWPDHPQAIPCLTAEFDFYVRQERAEAARDRVRELRSSVHPAFLDTPLCKLLTAFSRTYPDAEVRQLTRVHAVTVAARVLKQPLATADRGRVLQALTELRPEDSLLRRDVHRFLNPPPAKNGRPAARLSALQQARIIGASEGVLHLGERHRFTSLDHVVAAAYGNGMLAVAGNPVKEWSDGGRKLLRLECVDVATPRASAHLTWPSSVLTVHPKGEYLAMAWVHPSQLWLRHPLADPFATLSIPRLSSPDSQVLAGTLHTLPPDTIAVDACETVWVKALRANGTVSCHQANGKLLWTHGTPFEGTHIFNQKGFAVRRERIVLALHDSLHVLTTSKDASNMESHNLHRPIVSFSANSPYARPLIATGLSSGVAVLPLDMDEPLLVNDDLDSPLVVFTARGALLAFSEGSALAVQIRGNDPAKIQRFPWGTRPLAVTQGPERDQVIVVYADATWQVVEFQSKG